MTSPGSSEMEHSAALFASLARAGRLLASPSSPTHADLRPRSTPPTKLQTPRTEAPAAPPRPAAAMKRTTATPEVSTPPPPSPTPMPGGYRSDQMASILRNMCKRGGFSGALVADRGGLPLADFNCPVELEMMAALGSILGESLEHAARLLQRPDANNLSLDINYVDKIVLRTFEFERLPYHLLVICPQAVDERSEVELSIEQIQNVLSHEM